MKWTVLFAIVLCFSAAAESEVYKITVLKDVPPPQTATNTRIIGGFPTTIERHPFTVQILLNSALQCGGSILTPRHVLSAAHCFFANNNQIIAPRNFRVRAGTARLNSGGTAVSVSMIIVHERYNALNHDNDIAVLLLASSLRFSQSINAIALPPQGYEAPDNSSVTHTGWGRTNPNINQASETLQEVTVLTVNRTVCAQRYRELQVAIGEPMTVTYNMICAGLLDVGGRDACQGDSGGPLIYSNIMLLGVTSWGYGCADPRYPGVNARVSSYTTWINNTVTRYNDATHLQVPLHLLLAGILTIVTRKNII